MFETVRRKFLDIFDTEPQLFKAPGRINIIGEHTDYNKGLVLPAAIDKYAYLGVSQRKDKDIRIFSVNYYDLYRTGERPLERSGKGWPDYILGVLSQFERIGIEVPGLNIVFGGDVPQGAGMSSSAALESVTVVALNTLLKLNLPKLQLAQMAQAAEQRFVGVNCGLMDQFASIFGKHDYLIRLDCRSLEYEYIPFFAEGYSLLLLDTGVKHALADSAYNERRAACERGLKRVQAIYPEIQSLRDVDLSILEEVLESADPEAFRKCRYVLKENQRVEQVCQYLSDGDVQGLGRSLNQSHQGLKEEYDVSCQELDILVDAALGQEGVLGARMMGGGFGGCTLNLIKTAYVHSAVEHIGKTYYESTGNEMQVYPVSIGDGACEVSQEANVFQ